MKIPTKRILNKRFGSIPKTVLRPLKRESNSPEYTLAFSKGSGMLCAHIAGGAGARLAPC